MKRAPIYICALYFFAGVLWIFFSDRLLVSLVLADDLTLFQHIKGVFYIAATTIGLYYLISYSHKKIAESTSRYRELFRKNPNAMFIFDTVSHRVLEANQAALQVYGYDRKEFLSIRIDDVEDNASPLLAPGQEDNELGFVNYGVRRHFKRGGEPFYVNMFSHKISYKNKSARLVLAQDITQQKNYEDQLLDLNKDLELIVRERTRELHQLNQRLSESNEQLLFSNRQLTIANSTISDQAEVIRLQSEENVDRILDAVNDVVWSIDLKNCRYEYLSKSVEEVSGWPLRQFQEDLNFWKSIVHKSDKPVFYRRGKNLVRNGFSETTYRINKADGSFAWILDKSTLIRDPNGNPARMEGIFSDITSIKFAHEEAIDYARKLDMILETISDGFLIVDKTWKLTRVNKSMENLTGEKQSDMIGQSIWTVFEKNTFPEFFRLISLAMNRGKSCEFEKYFSSFEAWVQIKAFPYVDGLSIFFRDVSKEKAIRQEMFYSKKNLDALINNTVDIIWSIDHKMNLLSANKAFREFLKKSDNIEIKSGESVVGWSPERAEWAELYQRALSGEYFKISRQFTRSGSPRFFEISFNPIFDDATVIGVGCFAREITERKKFEEERSMLIEKLLAQNRDLEEFGYVTSHKLRAPIANILGIMKVFNCDDPADELNLKLLDYLTVAAENLDNIIKDLTQILDIQKATVPTKEDVDLEEVVKQVKTTLNQQLLDSHATLTVNFNKIEKIYSVRTYLVNILAILITNSIRYKKNDRNPKIHVSAASKNGYWCIAVRDNGLGIDLEKYGDQIFQLYKRFHTHTQGKGMGLYLVKSQVEALDGKLEVSSKVNAGTTFKIFLKKSHKKSNRKEQVVTHADQA